MATVGLDNPSSNIETIPIDICKLTNTQSVKQQDYDNNYLHACVESWRPWFVGRTVGHSQGHPPGHCHLHVHLRGHGVDGRLMHAAQCATRGQRRLARQRHAAVRLRGSQRHYVGSVLCRHKELSLWPPQRHAG